MNHKKLQNLRKNKKKSKIERLRGILDITFTTIIILAVIYLRIQGHFNTIYIVHEYKDGGIVTIMHITQKEYLQRMEEFKVNEIKLKNNQDITLHIMQSWAEQGGEKWEFSKNNQTNQQE